MNDLESRLTELSERGTHIGAEQLRQRVMLDLGRAGATAHLPARGWVIAVATAVITIVLVGVPLILFGQPDDAIAPGGPRDMVPTGVSVPEPATGIRLEPVPSADPVTMSTSLGEFEFVTMRLPDGQVFDFPRHMAATPHGLVAVDDGTMWWSSDSTTWSEASIGGDSGITLRVGNDVVVLRERGASRFVWNGDAWVAKEQIEVPGHIDWMAFGPRGIIAANPTTVYYSADGVRFRTAERGPDLATFVASEESPEDAEFVEAARMDCRGTFGATESSIRTVLATDSGFVAFTSASHPADEVCAPLLWFSPDGNSWDLVSPDSPFGQAAAVNTESIAERGGRFVAVGGIEAAEQGFVWVSDDAVTWRQADVRVGYPLTVDAGELGWVLVGAENEREAASDFALWASADGSTWDGPHPLPEGLLAGYVVPEIVVGTDTIVGVGFDQHIFVIGTVRAEARGG